MVKEEIFQRISGNFRVLADILADIFGQREFDEKDWLMLLQDDLNARKMLSDLF